ncbi:MAG: hypothetical protein Q8Q08_12310 [Candidatus Omnitrophota bacterium]|nr:hypothetical protein [Candidatus Omnitrophota bacterium]MDZ4241328.1 hypothetical protein [Candidatus Omnitrophota bacterium]
MRRRILVLAGLVWFLAAAAGRAEDPGWNFDPDTKYNIYVSGASECLAVVNNVQIQWVKEISGTAFLGVRIDTFDVGRTGGLIALEYVRAILPSSQIGLLSSQQKIRY